MGARFTEISPIPRTVSRFLTEYQDRIFYGTDMDPNPKCIAPPSASSKTADEHFYPAYFRKYHWPMHAFSLPHGVLKKIYRENARRVLN